MELEALAALETGTGVLGVLAVALPVAAVRLVGRILYTFAAACDLEYASADEGVVRLVPLKFLIAYESVFKLPASGVGRTRSVELVMPDECHTSVRARVCVRIDGTKKW